MSRQVDIKSLVSHIVRGDGFDKCRICMGDTSQGQVHLTDTVMMDGDKAVTLSELLEVITGVEMDDKPGLPHSICHDCFSHITTFLPFLKLCKQSDTHWTYLSEKLLDVSLQMKTTTAYIFVNEFVRTVTQIDRNRNNNMKNVVQRVNRISKEMYPQNTDRLTNLRVYSCVECGSKYRKLSQINLHLANQNKRLCTHCYKIVNLKTFAEHLKIHDIPFFKCEVCSLPFRSQELLRKHKTMHIGRNMCSECKRTFPTADILTLHVLRKHEADVCYTCDKKFSNRVCLFKHRRLCRSQTHKKYICDYCSKEFKDRSVIKSHITLIHARKLMHQCESCGKQFNSACHLEEHYETHDVIVDRYVCEYCDKIYRTIGGFKRHLRLKHYKSNPELKKRYSCAVCERSFISEKNLRKHLKTKNHKDLYRN